MSPDPFPPHANPESDQYQGMERGLAFNVVAILFPGHPTYGALHYDNNRSPIPPAAWNQFLHKHNSLQWLVMHNSLLEKDVPLIVRC